MSETPRNALHHLLLMTATITPPASMGNNLRQDPDLRLQDYAEALRFYLSLPPGGPQSVLFCENSGSDLSSLRELSESENPHGRKVEFLSYVTDMPPERGKGCGELDILDRAHDEVLAARPEVMVWKVTGRLVVKNLSQMIASLPKGAAFYGDFRSVPVIGEKLGGNDWLDTRLLAYRPDYYAKYVHGMKEKCGICTEKCLFAAIRPAIDGDPGIAPRFRAQPVFRGICGGSNEDYEALPARAKNLIRSVGRRVAPGVWL
ncbi:MAG: hypothetical protein ACK5JR_14670 [Tropicimonas sp.]|uniref:hypothetical protein n=1 Tax=Tropicimonas sp. TaxID=2067044 RepID=UPI003A8B8033